MNQAVFLALLQPGDTFMGLDLAAGGHLTHGSPVNMSGKWFNAVPYGVRREDQRLDMDEVRAPRARAQAEADHRRRAPPIRASGTSPPSARSPTRSARTCWSTWRTSPAWSPAARTPRPFPHAHVVTTTTHKTLRGPRSGVILSNDEALAKPLNMAVFPGLQGGPLVHVIAAKAVAFGEALRPEFKAYAASVVENAKALAASLEESGLRIVSGGTDNHLMLVDLTPKDVTGKAAEKGLDRAYLTCNKNGDPVRHAAARSSPRGVRLGTPAGTTRGFGPAEFRKIGGLIAEVVEGLARNGDEGDGQVEESVRRRVGELCAAFPVYPGR